MNEKSLPTLKPSSELAHAATTGLALNIQRAVLSNGIVVLGTENPTHPSVVIRLGHRAGPILESPELAGVAALTASGLMRGTIHRSFEEINETVDAAGMGLSSGSGRHLSSVSSRCLVEDLRMAIELMADVAQNPTFPQREIDQLRGQILTGLRQADNDTGAVADRQFRELVYPLGHPYRLRTHGYVDTVSHLTRNHLEAFHATHYGPAGAFIVAAGDIVFGELVVMLEEAFGDWRGPGTGAVSVETPPAPEPIQREVVVPGKTQSDLVVGVPSIRRNDSDFHPLRMANLILGQLGMMGRLGEAVREEQGLAYGVHSELDAGLGPGPWCIRAGVNPANVDKALDAIRAEMHRLVDGGVTDDELERGKNYSAGSLVLRLETNDGVAALMQDVELFDLGLDYAERYPGIIRALTRDAVNAAASRHIPRYEATVRVIAGPAR
jgi:zinc protease